MVRYFQICSRCHYKEAAGSYCSRCRKPMAFEEWTMADATEQRREILRKAREIRNKKAS